MPDFKNKIELLVIDPQNDFHDQPNATLGVPGAMGDAKRLAKLIESLGAKIDDIHVTQDTHQLMSIFHPIYWVDKKGNNPAPFTLISRENVESGTWKTNIPLFHSIALEYVKQLEVHNRYQLIVWPFHCLLGGWGHNIQDDIGRSLMDWEMKYKARVDYILKGHSMHTEHYSAVQADVPSDDPTTQLNTRLIETLQRSKKIWIAGQASSHCVANTGTDIANIFGADSVGQLVFIEDCMSPVAGFEQLSIDFFADMKKRGAVVTTSKQLLS